MNYRHAFHAGAFTDVMKHAILSLLLERLCAKPSAFCVLDTHAGIGRYDLDGADAKRTGEADGGIRRLVAQQAAEGADAALAALSPYLKTVQTFNGGTLDPLRVYPGSPCVTRAAMRDDDRLVLAELHPEDVLRLRAEFSGDRQVSVHHTDGYQSLKAHLPPRERRGLVLIDPPFEEPNEFDRMVAGLALAHHRWPTGQYALWYPIKERAAVWRFHAALEATQIPRQLIVELTIRDETDQTKLNGSGMILVNPPWQLDQQLATVMPALHRVLTLGGGGSRVEWLTSEG